MSRSLSKILLVQPVNGYLGKLTHAFRFGQEAVMVFFVLSGFVIYWATSKPDVSIERFSSYFVKRFSRIYSVWFPAILAMCAMASISAGKIVMESPEVLLGNALMLQDFASGKPAVVCDAVYGNTPLWSLHYEWWFYMIFPLSLCVQNWTVRTHVVGVMCLAGAVSYAVIPNPASRILLYFGIWWIGAHAAAVIRDRGQVCFRDVAIPCSYVALGSLPMIALCVLSFRRGDLLSLGIHPVLETRHLLSSVVTVGLAFIWRRLGWIGFRWTIGLFAFVAPISFSLYVLHYNSIVHASYLRFIGSPAIELLLYILFTIAFCMFLELAFYPRIRLALAAESKSTQLSHATRES